ncbi:MAG: AAA family ATPase [Caldilineaceae bacterium]
MSREQQHPWRFLASSMSDGTLRALGVLLAIFQSNVRQRGQKPLLIGLEEPEMALHPAAAGVLLAALREASRSIQILVTSHSPDLLDNPDIDTDSLLAVESADALTHWPDRCRRARDVAPATVHGRRIAPSESAFTRSETITDVLSERQLKLFELNGR